MAYSLHYPPWVADSKTVSTTFLGAPSAENTSKNIESLYIGRLYIGRCLIRPERRWPKAASPRVTYKLTEYYVGCGMAGNQFILFASFLMLNPMVCILSELWLQKRFFFLLILFNIEYNANFFFERYRKYPRRLRAPPGFEWRNATIFIKYQLSKLLWNSNFFPWEFKA